MLQREKRTTSSKTGLFLLELIISLLFFALAATVCVNLFVKSHTIGNNTKTLNAAVSWTQNIAECFLGSSCDVEALASFYSNPVLTSTNDNILPYSSMLIHLNSDFEEAPESEASYSIVTDFSYDNTIYNADIMVFSYSPENYADDKLKHSSDADECIYSLHVSKHIAERSYIDE